MRRYVSILLACLLLFSLAPACSWAADNKVETVHYFSSIGAYKDLLESEITAWNETVGVEKGIFIEMETNIDNYVTALDLALKSGNAPDLFNRSTTAHVMGGYVASLDDIPEVQETLDLYRDVLIPGQNIIAGKTYTVPNSIYPIKFVYNKDLFKKNGIVDENGEAKAPETLEEMVEYARIITENGNGEEYGYVLSFGVSIAVRRLVMKSFIMSTGAGWYNNTLGEYDFAPFAPLFEAIKTIFDEGSAFPGYETISADALRAQFSEGKIGMMCSPSYDIGVLVNQFPAKCDWGVCDPPQIVAPDTCEYNGVGYMANGVAISSSVSEDRMWAVAEAWNFINSEALNAKLYATGNIIPSVRSFIDYARENYEFVDMKNWDVMSDLTNYDPMPNYPDPLLILEGDTYQGAFQKYIYDEMTLDEMIEDLNTRYNAAYVQGIADGTISESDYHYAVDLSR